ncbi:MAG: RMD1 family protein [Cyanobacteria bacterium J06638_6]
MGQVEIVDKPERLWEYPEPDPLYYRLEDEYEIRDRPSALERKLELVSRTTKTVLDLQRHCTGLRLE